MAKFFEAKQKTVEYLKDQTLTDLANKLETDKGTADKSTLSWGNSYPRHFSWHYTPVYEKYMDPVRENNVRFLEIGICDKRFPFASTQMWLSYFKNVELFSVDNFWGNRSNYGDDIQKVVEMGSHFIFADQGSEDDWNHINTEVGQNSIDFIVEDGSHAPEHMMYSLYRSVDILKSGGYYFMEDIQNPETSKGWFGYDNAEIFNELQNWNDNYNSQYITPEQSKYIKDNCDFVELQLDPSRIKYLAVFRKK